MKENDSTSNSTAIPNQNLEQQTSHAIIILASGLSRRLGEAKQLLYKNGVSLISHMLRLAASTNPQVIIVVIPKNDVSIASAITELATQHATIQTVTNPTPKTGMAHSLCLGIEALTHLDSCDHLSINRVLIMGVDQILLEEEHLLTLLAGKKTVVASGYSSLPNWRNWQDLAKTAATETIQKDIIGLPLAIDYKLLKQWQALLTGDKGLRHLIRGLPSSQVSTVNNHQLSYDIDTPEQLAYARQQGWVDDTRWREK